MPDQYLPSANEIERLFHLAGLGLWENNSLVLSPKLLMEYSIAKDPALVLGRLVHGVQVSGIGSTGQQVQIHVSLDYGVTWTQLGATITADSVVQLAQGAYTNIKAVLSTAGGTTLAEIVDAGETAIDTTSAATFPTTGYALIGGADLISYSGKSTNTLTGVPATGDLASEAHAAGVAIRPANLKIALVSFR